MVLVKTLSVPPDVGAWCAWNNNLSQLVPFSLVLVNPMQALLILPRCALAMLCTRSPIEMQQQV